MAKASELRKNKNKINYVYEPPIGFENDFVNKANDYFDKYLNENSKDREKKRSELDRKRNVIQAYLKSNRANMSDDEYNAYSSVLKGYDDALSMYSGLDKATSLSTPLTSRFLDTSKVREKLASNYENNKFANSYLSGYGEKTTYDDVASDINEIKTYKAGAQRRGNDTSKYDHALGELNVYADKKLLDTDPELLKSDISGLERKVSNSNDREKAMWLAEYNNGDFSGEMSLMTNEERQEYINRADEYRAYFKEKYGRDNITLANIADFSTEVDAYGYEKEIDEKQNLLNRIQRENPLSEYEGLMASSDFVSNSAVMPNTNEKLGVYNKITATGELPKGGILNSLNPEEHNAYVDGQRSHWELLTDDEKSIYYYLYNTQGENKAYEFLDHMQSALNKRKSENDANALYKVLEEHPSLYVPANVASVPLNLAGGVMSSVYDAGTMLTGQEYDPYSNAHSMLQTAQNIRSKTASEIDEKTNGANLLGFTVGDAYQALMSGADSITGGLTVGGTATMASLGGTAFSTRAKEMYEQGESVEDIAVGATAAATFEALFEKLSLDQLLSPKSSGIIVDALKQAGVEASEEISTEVANSLFDLSQRGKNSDIYKSAQEYIDKGYSENKALALVLAKKAYEAGMGGLISGGASGGLVSIPSTIENLENKRAEKQNLTSLGQEMIFDGTSDKLLELAMSMGDVNKKVSSKAKKLSNTDVTKIDSNREGDKYSRNIADLLIDTSDTVVNEFVKSKVNEHKDKLGEKGTKNAQKAVFKAYKGEVLTDAETELINKVSGETILREIDNSTMAELTEKTPVLNKLTELAQLAESPTEQAETNETTERLNSSEQAVSVETSDGYQVSFDGYALDNSTDKQIELAGFDKISKGAVQLKTADNSSVNKNDVVYKDDVQGVVYESIASLNIDGTPIDAETANIILGEVTAKDVTEAKYQMNALKGAFRRGANTQSVATLIDENGQPFGGLPIESLIKVNNAGMALKKKYENASEELRGKALKMASKEAEIKPQQKKGSKGKVTYRGGKYAVMVKANARQVASVDVLERLSDALGVEIEVFASRKDAQGRYTGKNGSYNRATGKIEIDINAGSDGKGTILYTLSHELTHNLKVASPKLFEKLSSFLVKEYEKQNKSVDEAIQVYENRGLSYDVAREEWVADSMESMFVRAFEGDTKQLNRLQQKCHDVWLKIREMLTKFAKVICKEYKELSPETEAGKFVAQLSDETFNVLKEMYFEGLGAIAQQREHFDGLEDLVSFLDKHNISREGTDLEYYKTKNTAKNDGVRMQVRKEFSAELQEWFDSTTHEERKVSGKRFLVGSTTDVLKSIGVKDYNIYFGGSKIDKIISDNSSMNLNIIKQAINLLEDPILIMKSRTVEDSIVLFGEVYTEGNKPVMISVLLRPKTKDGEILDYAVITSVYGRRSSNLQNLINESHIYYVNENKKRTDKWLKALGLQLPSALTKYGSIDIISDTTAKINQNSENTDTKNKSTTSSEPNALIAERYRSNASNSRISQGNTTVNNNYMQNEVKNEDGNEERFSIREEVEETKTLIAVHNLSEKKLIKSLNLGGLPMPSIAIVKAKDGHAKYGEISLVFDKSTIDPKADKRNKVYGDDAWTPTYPRVNFEALHYEETLENVIKLMKQQPAVGGIPLVPGDEVLSVSAKRYPSIDKIKADETRLHRPSKDELVNLRNDFIRRFLRIAQRVMDKNESDHFEAIRNAIECIIKSIKKSKTKSGILKNLKKYPKLNVTETTASDIVDLVTDIANMPTEYFEAKPHRAVGFEEVTTAIIPDNSSGELKSLLSKHKVKYIEYDAADKQSRIDALNSVEEVRFSPRDYSYDALVSKPDMKITKVDDTISYDVNSQTRKSVVNQGIDNAKLYGEVNNGAVSVYVDDIEANVIISKNSLVHGIDRRLQLSAPVIINIGSIVKNSVLINEITPKKPTASASFVLIGYAESDTHSYIVRMVVNQYTNEVDKVDVLYAINTKKEPAGKMPGSHGKTALPTGSTISISDLLDLVNKYFPDVLPEDVLKHYEYDARPEGDLSGDILYQPRPELDDLIFDDFDGEVTDNDARLMTEYFKNGHTDIMYHLVNRTRSIEIADKAIDRVVNRLVRSYRISTEHNEDIKSTITELLNSKNETQLSKKREQLAESFKKALGKTEFISSKDAEMKEALYTYLRTFGKRYTVSLTDEQLELLQAQGHNLGWLRQQLYGRVSIVKKDTVTKKSRVTFSEFYEQLVEAFPDLFDTTETSEYPWDALLDKLNYYKKPVGVDIQEAFGMTADELSQELTARVFADAVESKYKTNQEEYVKTVVNNLRHKHNYKVKEARIKAKQMVDNKFDKFLESTQKKQLRNKIINLINKLDKLLNKGSKERNVKEEMCDMVANALSLSKLIFKASDVTNREIIEGLNISELDKSQVRYVERYKEFLGKLKDKEELYEKVAKSENVNQKALENIQKDIKSINNSLSYIERQLSDLLKRERARIYEAPVADAVNALANAYYETSKSTVDYIANAYDADVLTNIQEFAVNVGGTRIKDMTPSQLDNVYRLYKTVLASVYNANRGFTSLKKASLEDSVNAMAEQVKATGKEREISANDKREERKLSRHKFTWNNLKSVYAFRRLGSDVLTNVFWEIQKAQGEWAKIVEETHLYRQKLSEKYNYTSWDFEKTHDFISKKGKISLKLGQILSLYGYVLRGEQALGHICNEGIWQNSKINSIERELLSQIIDELTDSQKMYVQEMIKYLSKNMGAYGNKVSRMLHGCELFKEENYLPIICYNPKTEKSKQFKSINRIKNFGFTHGLQIGAKGAIVLEDFNELWAKHCHEMALYSSFALPLEDFTRLYNYKFHASDSKNAVYMKDIISRYHTEATTNYIEQFIDDINNGNIVSGRLELGKLLSTWKLVKTAGSFAIGAIQGTSVAKAMVHINPKYFISTAPKKYAMWKHKSDYKELEKYAPIAIIKRMGYFDTGVGKNAVDWILSDKHNTIGERLIALVKDEDYRTEFFYKIPSFVDECAWVQIWHAVKAEIKDTTNLTGEAYLERCGERFNEVIELTQVYDSVISRTAVMRSNEGLDKMSTAFMSETMVSANMVQDAMIQGKRLGAIKGGIFIARTMGSIFTSIVLSALIKGVYTAGRDDDEDKAWIEKYISSVMNELWNNMNPLNYIIVVKDIISLIQGYDVQRADFALVNEFVEAIDAVVGLFAKDDEIEFDELKTDEEKEEKKKERFRQTCNVIGDLLIASASFFKTPLGNITKDIKSVVNSFKSDKTTNKYALWESFYETIPFIGKDTKKYERAYNAYTNGDMDIFKDTVNEMLEDRIEKGDDEDEAKTKVRTTFTNNFKDIYLDGYRTSNTEKMMEIQEFLYATGLYGSLTDLNKDLKGWVKDYEKEKQEVAEKNKENN